LGSPRVREVFLGLDDVQVQAFQRAFDVNAPSPRVASKHESLLRSVQARGLGRHEVAFVAPLHRPLRSLPRARSSKRHKLEIELAAFLERCG
jgi:hypothetical protein